MIRYPSDHKAQYENAIRILNRLSFEERVKITQYVITIKSDGSISLGTKTTLPVPKPTVDENSKKYVNVNFFNYFSNNEDLINFPSMGELAIQMLYDYTDDIHPPTTIVKSKIIEMLDAVFSPTLTTNYTVPADQRRSLYLHCQPDMSWKLSSQKSRFPEETSAGICIYNGIAAGSSVSYADALQYFEANNLDVPVLKTFLFENCDFILMWAINQIIDNHTSFHKCPVCNKYFIKKARHQKYCSNVCTLQHNKKNPFGGQAEIAKKYQAIDKMFRRKCTQTNYYYSYVEPIFDGDFSPNAFFENLENFENYDAVLQKHDIANQKHFECEDFVKMFEHFKEQRKIFQEPFNTASKQLKKGLLDQTTYDDIAKAYLSWLDNVYTLLSACKRIY